MPQADATGSRRHESLFRYDLVHPFIRSAEDHCARFVYKQAQSLLSADENTSVVIVTPHALACNLANVMPTLALPKEVEHRSLSTLA